ncbi:MAG: RHS repeat protein [Xanthomonadaceae bacterium]|nr:RHS repeat protein [Xanthomonadaceae bacterium]
MDLLINGQIQLNCQTNEQRWAWNARNQLAQIKAGMKVVTRFEYDAAGR